MVRRRQFHEAGTYEIRVQGHLDAGWCQWFDGWTMTREQGGTTLLTGQVADQPALHGTLIRIRDLGLPLLLVRRVERPA